MPIKIHRRGEIWHYSGTVAGRRIRGSTGTKDKTRAQRIAAEAENSEWNRHLDGPGAHVTMAQAAIAYRQAGKPTRFLEKIEDHWKDTPLRSITAGAIRQSALDLYPNATAATRNRQVIAPTQAMINHAAELDWCAPIRVKRFPVDPKSRQVADFQWIDAFAKQATMDGLPHLAGLCVFMFGTGARIGEAVRVVWGDIDFAARSVILSGKKPQPWTRTAHLQPALIAALANIPAERNLGDRVFRYLDPQNVKQSWESIVRRAGIKRITPHGCRHGFATAMLRAGWDVKTVAEMGGWKDAGIVLKHYAHAIKDRTITDAIFATNSSQGGSENTVTSLNIKEKKA